MSDDTEKSPPPTIDLPTVEELKVEVVPVGEDNDFQEDWERHSRALSPAQEELYIRLGALSDHYAHKGKWSYFLMFLMLLMVAFQSVLLGLVGGGVWDFTAYDWLLPLLLVQNFASIVGLAVWVVKALFKDITK